MKRYISILLSAILLLSCISIGAPKANASTKEQESRAIAIVFDNSGSMYDAGDQAWCRATYAMEVFASMLNKGDVLQIYPMWPITVGGKVYTMEDPLQINDSAKASTIRDIFTENASGTPIESIDCAIEGVQKINADKKYVVVLTDGGTFSKNGSGLTKDRTVKELDKRIQANAGKSMDMMYLGVGAEACMPTTIESEHFKKAHAVDTNDVLSSLTVMCNQIFGRDTLPKSRISGKSIEFDISMSKLIVFVQGENISNLKLSGSGVGQQVGSQQTKYSTRGAGDYRSVPDTSLQGMIVTYTDCAVGKYNIEYTGTATSVEVYYEPDADMEFIFTDSEGNIVDPNALYEGEYKVKFGMKDAKTGKLIDSDLLGTPHYQGSYFINGEEKTFNADGASGEVPITLKMGDTFKANLTATYLSGYTIKKDSSDFGWPEGGIMVAPRPAGDLKLVIEGGDEQYSLQDLEEGSPYIAKVYYQGTQLTGSELEGVTLKWDPDTSNAEITQEFADDHYNLYLHYKNTDKPQDTVCGECTVSIYAFYTPHGSDEAQTFSPLTYNIKDDFSPLQMSLVVPQSYIVIKELDNSQPIMVNLTLNRAPLNAEDFSAVELLVNSDGIAYEATPNAQTSSYQIKLKGTEGLAERDYTVKVTAVYTDHIGRETPVEETVTLTLSNTPLWVKWAIGLLLLLIIFLIIWAILHIKVLPSNAHISKRDSKVLVDGEDVTKFCNFSGSASDVTVKYGGSKIGLSFPSKAGKESYLCKSQTKRYAVVIKPDTVKRIGNATIESATIGSVRYVLNEKGVLERKPASKAPLNIKHGMPIIYSGTITSAGVKKSFNVNTKFNFKKK